MDCFERLPEVISEANEHLFVYSEHADLCNEKSLRKTAVTLSVAILEAIRVMISWFEKPEWRQLARTYFIGILISGRKGVLRLHETDEATGKY